MAEQSHPAARSDDAYALGDTSRSWFQREPDMSLRMLDAAGVCSADSLIDVGGGASTLVNAVVTRGFKDVTVLDVSATGMRLSRQIAFLHVKVIQPWQRGLDPRDLSRRCS
jgi:hypothetical protein